MIPMILGTNQVSAQEQAQVVITNGDMNPLCRSSDISLTVNRPRVKIEKINGVAPAGDGTFNGEEIIDAGQQITVEASFDRFIGEQINRVYRIGVMCDIPEAKVMGESSANFPHVDDSAFTFQDTSNILHNAIKGAVTHGNAPSLSVFLTMPTDDSIVTSSNVTIAGTSLIYLYYRDDGQEVDFIANHERYPTTRLPKRREKKIINDRAFKLSDQEKQALRQGWVLMITDELAEALVQIYPGLQVTTNGSNGANQMIMGPEVLDATASEGTQSDAQPPESEGPIYLYYSEDGSERAINASQVTELPKRRTTILESEESFNLSLKEKQALKQGWVLKLSKKSAQALKKLYGDLRITRNSTDNTLQMVMNPHVLDQVPSEMHSKEREKLQKIEGELRKLEEGWIAEEKSETEPLRWEAQVLTYLDTFIQQAEGIIDSASKSGKAFERGGAMDKAHKMTEKFIKENKKEMARIDKELQKINKKKENLDQKEVKALEEFLNTHGESPDEEAIQKVRDEVLPRLKKLASSNDDHKRNLEVLLRSVESFKKVLEEKKDLPHRISDAQEHLATIKGLLQDLRKRNEYKQIEISIHERMDQLLENLSPTLAQYFRSDAQTLEEFTQLRNM